MRNVRLLHEAAWALATSLLEVMGTALEGQARADLFGLVYATVRAGLTEYDDKRERMEERLHPGRHSTREPENA